jgi:phosphoserine phosphatase
VAEPLVIRRYVRVMTAGVVFLDIDGTLVPETSSSQYLASFLGHLADLAVAEHAYANHELDNLDVSVLDAAGWCGHTTGDVRGWLAELPIIDGVDDVVAWCRDHALAVYLATLAWHPVGEYLCETFGLDGFCGPELGVTGDRFTGEVEAHFDEFGKRDFAVAVAAALNVPLNRCVAVGDSRSDLPLFTSVGLSVAFNGDEAARTAADVSLAGRDLRMILPMLEPWVTSLG